MTNTYIDENGIERWRNNKKPVYLTPERKEEEKKWLLKNRKTKQ